MHMDTCTRMMRSAAAFGFGLALVLALLVLLTSNVVADGTVLQPGDIAIIGFNADNPDAYVFVLLRDVAASTAITFTDNGWTAAGAFRATEGTAIWTASTALSAGTVVSGPIGTMLFSTAGDQILAYQGLDSNPSFVYALNSEAASWQADSTSSNTSALPTGLVDGETAAALVEIDNAKYDASNGTSGTKAELLALVSNPSNWTGNDVERLDLTFAPFDVSTPSANLLLSKSVTPETDVIPGSTVTYTIRLENSGNQVASGVLLTDSLPSEADLASLVTAPSGTSAVDDVITWSGDVGVAEVLTWTFTAAVTGTQGATVIEGGMGIDFRDGVIELRTGEMVVVPRGVEHRPFAEDECLILLVEPAGTINTGDAGGELTAKDGSWI
jgi:uncharacterized repeat protein (TIGR01451 family)